MRRRRPARLVVVAMVLVVVLGVPAVALAALWRWADERATGEVTPDDGPPSTPVDVPPGARAPTLATSMLSMRRLPGPLVERAIEIQLADDLDDLLGEVLDGADAESCAAVAIGGELAASAGSTAGVDALSIQRLLIASVALEVLGADHRFVTRVFGPPIVDGVIEGDVVLVGGGDPLLRTIDDAGDAVDAERGEFSTTFDAVADQLVDAGLARVEGDLVGDGTRYDAEFSVPSWGIGIPRGIGGPYGALLVNRGRLFGAGYGLNPSQSAANELNRLLGQREVAVTGRNRAAVESTGESGDGEREGLTVHAEIESAPLSDIIAEMFRSGDPNIAELLVKEIAVADGHRPGSRLAGLSVIKDRLSARGIDVSELDLEDGSGLSDENRVSCEILAAVLAGETADSPLLDGLASDDGEMPAGFSGADASRPGAASMAGAITDRAGEAVTVAVVIVDDRLDDDGTGTGSAEVIDRWERLVTGLSSLPPDVAVDSFAPR